MNVIKTAIPGMLIIEPEIFDDSRGFFIELYRADRYGACGISRTFLQDNISRSEQGTIRGLHFQARRPQGKLVTVLHGSILDIAVDVRKGSPAFGQHVAIELDDQNRRQCWLPGGLAHGFVTCSAVADVFYKCDEVYDPDDQVVLRWDDPQLGINWGRGPPRLSSRDLDGIPLTQLHGLLPTYRSS
jgi:dTDP-4-dehydrorhamnose 3,5-epimerase